MSEPITDPGPVDTTDAAPPPDVPADSPTEPAQLDTTAPAEADDQDHGDIGKARKQAARYRERLRETETERDTLRGQLTAQHRALVDWRATTGPTAVDPALLDAAGINVDELLDDNGNVDMGAVDAFIGATAARFNVARGFKPNRAQGASGHGPMPASKPSLADAFKPR